MQQKYLVQLLIFIWPKSKKKLLKLVYNKHYNENKSDIYGIA